MTAVTGGSGPVVIENCAIATMDGRQHDDSGAEHRINPQAVEGQIQGGIAQGLGLAVMEEIQVSDGVVRNPSFTDYLIPTILDMPPVRLDVLELADPRAPYGLRGVGEPPTISSTPAVVAAIRAATGRDLTRVPVRPEHITAT
jgi:CO/xanthine dehydrogenase Mo-binding subunit